MIITSLLASGAYSQDSRIEETISDKILRGGDIKGDLPTPFTSLTAISSTAPGGLWSSPATWAGGVVPGPGDDVTISTGSAVVIDTAVTVANLTVGPEAGINSGVLTFDPLAAQSLTVNGDLTVNLGILTTPTTGTVTGHTITVGGNLTNNGIFDVSTNGNLAGAGLTFTNSSNNTFGGGGSLTDIRTITVNKGTSTASTLELTVSNFTVQGSSIDGPASGYLTLINGFFKVSGLFSGNHRTFSTAAYSIPLSAGFWLNNPNYTVAAQTGDVLVTGKLTISTGVYNAGTASTDVLRGSDMNGLITVEGGSLNVSGAMRQGQWPGDSYRQTGGVTTLCIAGNFAPCYTMSGIGTGGSLVIQTPNPVPNENSPDFFGRLGPVNNGLTVTTLRFGNAATSGTGFFTCSGNGPDIAIDTTSGSHTVKIVANFFQPSYKSINIGAGGTLDIGVPQIEITGDTFINNGTFKVNPASQVNLFRSVGPVLHDVTYSGTGSFSGAIGQLYLKRSNLILDPGVNSFRTRNIRVDTSNIVNAGRLTIGLNDAFASTVQMEGTASFDSSPVFDLGTGGQKLVYSNAGTRAIGPELNAARQLAGLTHDLSTGTLSITGGDITLDGSLIVLTGVIDTGANRLVHMSGDAVRGTNTGFIKGTLVRRFSDSNPGYTFFVGDNHYARAQITASSVTGTTDVAVTAHDLTLAGLPPAKSASFSWDIQQTGSMTSTLTLSYDNADINGVEANYRAWRSTGSPAVVPSTVSAANNTVTAVGLTDLSSGWGISERLANISISGGVFSSGGAGIRSAIVTLSGGNLTAPRVIQTGPFGTYVFTGVEAGFQYTVSVSAKRNRFTPSSQVITPLASVTDLNFVANPSEE